jgi:hypothetical protein
MLEYLKPLKNKKVDCIMFFEGSAPNKINVEAHTYNEPGEPLGGSAVGNMYHIVLVKDHETDKDKFTDFDQFEAILACPLEYISGLIPTGWYGVIAKKTTTSQTFIDKAVANISKLL